MPTKIRNDVYSAYKYQYTPTQPRVQMQNDQQAQDTQRVQNQQQQNVQQQKVYDNKQVEQQQRTSVQYLGNIIDLTA